MNASIVDFIKLNNIQEQFLKKRVICFSGNEYPFLFFSTFFRHLKQNNNFHVDFININDLEFSEIVAKLDQSFLGNELVYWLGNISEYKKRKELLNYLKDYKQPHCVGFFVNEDEAISEFKNKYNCGFINSIEQCKDLLFLWDKHNNNKPFESFDPGFAKATPDRHVETFSPERAKASSPARGELVEPFERQFNKQHNVILHFLENIFKKCSKMSLDSFCILVNYSILLGNKQAVFINQWLDKIIIDEQSFFSLSKYFFAYDCDKFFKCWNGIKGNYPIVFWTSYWSEQIYRAINFINLKDQGKLLQAKQIAYKLPFSFIQADYKNCSIDRLLELHELIYKIDYAAKNSGSEVMLELFYAKHFAQII